MEKSAAVKSNAQQSHLKNHVSANVLPEAPPFVVVVDGVRRDFLSFSEAFAEAVDEAYTRPGIEIELQDPEFRTLFIHVQADLGLKVKRR